tara:strand:+ start:41 stop:805 length:765 start_codon:yes stop_codon:yes gene_type:complete
MSINAHTFNVDLATKVGLNQAILLNHLFYWHQINSSKKHNIKDGSVWTYNTAVEFSKIFPYLTPRQIIYSFGKLKQEGYIISGNYNKAPFDQTKWYSLTEKALELFVNCNLHNVNSNIHNVESNIQSVKSNIQSVDPIPDNNTDNNPDNNTTISDDDIKGKIFFKIVELYPKNRIGNRQHGLKKFKKLDINQAKLAATNLKRYLKVAGQYVKNLQNYILEECWSDEWLKAEETKSQSNDKTIGVKTFKGNYESI